MQYGIKYNLSDNKNEHKFGWVGEWDIDLGGVAQEGGIGSKHII